MTDILLAPGTTVPFDLRLSGGDLMADDGLMTPIVVSLFTDRRVDDSEIPDGQTDPRGWWGDCLAVHDGAPVSTSQIGSKLWLLNREKSLQSVVERARQYARDALAWMVDAGIVKSLSVDASGAGTSRLRIDVSAERGTDSTTRTDVWTIFYDYAAGTVETVIFKEGS